MPSSPSWMPADPPDDSVGRHLLTPAVGAALTGLAARRPTAVLLEDLHWADAATLDLLTQLLSRGLGVPVVGTWRTHDPTTAPSVVQWFGHVRRGADVTVLDLRPLSADETAEQLLMLGLDPTAPRVAAIHARTAGQPLFTEQLAAHRDDGTALPRFLTDLLDQRFAAIADDAWLVARALGTADRSLPPAHLEVATGLGGDRLVGALRELRRRHLVRSDVDRAQLRHPLLAEAIRRRLVPGEAAGVHRALALALGAEPDAAPAEVANHWQAAGDDRQELTWRIRAARAARERFSVHESARQWVRVVEAWPPGTPEAGDPPLSHAEALIRAVEALSMVDVVAAHDLCPRALEAVPGAGPLVAAEILIIVANLEFDVRGVSDESLDMAARAVEILERAGPSLVLADALLRRATMLFNAGRLDEAARSSARVVEVCRQIDEPSFLMLALSRRGWYHLALGDVAASRRCFEEARSIDPEHCDPYDLVELATNHTDLLLQTGAGADEVVAAAAEALQTADEYGLDTFIVGMLIANVGQALREAGRVGEAARLVLPASEDAPGADRWPIHIERVNVESALGNADAALERASLLKELRVTSGAHRTYLSRCYAEAHLWAGQPGAALAELLPTLERAVAREDSMLFALALTTAARAGADEAAAGRRPVGAPERHELAARLHRLHGACSRDPFGPHPMIGHGTAARALWCAEIRRLEGRESLDLWTGAATEWDRLTRPHDAAYCRWRGARLALRRGDTTAAAAARARCGRRARARPAPPGDREHRGRVTHERAPPPRPAARPAPRPRRRPPRPPPPRRLALACAPSPARPASPTPPSPRPSPPPRSPPGAPSSSSSRPWTATPPPSTTSGSPPPPPTTSPTTRRPGSPAASPSSPPYDATSSPAPDSSSSPARPASARPRLVEAASASTSTFVATGHCLPLSDRGADAAARRCSPGTCTTRMADDGWREPWLPCPVVRLRRPRRGWSRRPCPMPRWTRDRTPGSGCSLRSCTRGGP